MGTHFYLLLFFQIIWPIVIGAPSFDVKDTMAHAVLDRLVFKENIVVHTIWQQEPSRACDIEKPPEEMLTDKRILEFNFVPYLCVILYDASLRYLELNTSQPGNAQEIIKDFSPNTFCQQMKDNKWFTTIKENKFWVSNFSNDMKNKNICQRYCVSDIVNPLCAYTLGLDSSVKKMKPESLHPSSVNAEEPHLLPPIPIPPKKEQTVALIDKQDSKPISTPHLSNLGPARVNEITGNKRKPPSVPYEGQTSGAVTARQFNGMQSALGDQFTATSSQNQYFANSIYPHISNIRDSAGAQLPGENILKMSDPLKTEKKLATSNEPSLPAYGRISALVTANGLEYHGHSNNAPDTHLSHASEQDFKPGGQVSTPSEHSLDPNPVLSSNLSKQEIRNPQKNTKVVKPSVSAPDQLHRPKPSGTTSSDNPQRAPVVVPDGHTGANVGSSPPVNEGEYNTERLEQMPEDHKASANLVGGHEPANGGRVDTSNVASQGDSPKPSVPESPKIPVLSEEKPDQVRMNTTVPENVTKAVSGSPIGGSTEPKPDENQIGKSEPEAANHAMEGEGRVISGEPDNHEEQNAMDDSQVENGDVLGGGDQAQDRDEPGLELEQEFATEPHRYNEGDNDEPSRPDGSTKLSNNNNNKDYMGSDEDEGPWPPAGRIPINDAEGGYAHDRFVDAEDSHFFAYFMTMIVLCILGYLIFHNKQKILALALEGRARKGTRRRPSTSGYRKLDSNLEEAVTSSCTGSSVTHVIY